MSETVTFKVLETVSGVNDTTLWKDVVLLRKMLRGELPT